MSFSLVLLKKSEEAKDFGENVYFDRLPPDCEVYIFYYPGPIRNSELERKLKDFGNETGKNLFINIGKLNDPNFKKITREFGIRKFPVLIVTGVGKLAAMQTETNYSTAFVRLDNQELLKNPDRTIETSSKIFALFISGRIAEALHQGKWDQRIQVLSKIKKTLLTVAKTLNEKDVSVSFLEGRFEIANRGVT